MQKCGGSLLAGLPCKMEQLVIWMVSEKLLGKCGDGRLKLEIGVLVVLVLAFGDD